MPYFRTVGDLPPKRRSRFSGDDGHVYSEELIGEEGFSSDHTRVYHRNPPTLMSLSERIEQPMPAPQENWPVRHRHFRSDLIVEDTDLVLGRRPLLSNADVAISVIFSTSDSALYRDADGDQCVYISEGSGKLASVMGDLPFRKGDYVVIPAGVTHSWHPEAPGVRALVIESRGHIKPPARYLSQHGQFLEIAPYRERDLHGPVGLSQAQTGPASVIVKRRGRLSRTEYVHHPYDVVGWDGCLYPYTLSIHDFEPIVGRFHQPPPVHQTFEGPGFVVCSFCPRPPDFDATAVSRPANHSNVDSDEVIFYAGGDYSARKGSGVRIGSLTLHPSGIPHGPQTPAAAPKPDVAMLDELAVMVDTFAPLDVGEIAVSVEDPDYGSSWIRALGATA